MILTGKCKEDFLEYYNNHSNNYLLSFTDFDDLPTSVKNALIIEWLDNMENKGQRFYLTFFEFNLKNKLPNWGFKEISEKAIEQCNEFYNSLELNQLP